MSSKGARVTGTDGSDFNHRQRVANSIKLRFVFPMISSNYVYFSVQNKFNLKLLYSIHILVLLAMWAKVGSEFAMKELGYKSEFFKRLDLPTAYPW